MIQIKPTHPRFKLPTYATEGAAAVDLSACIEEPIHLHPGQTALIPAGFAMALPDNLAALIIPRSGIGFKHGIVLGNLVGLIDQDYRGGVGLSVWNRNHEGQPFTINPGDRIAQMIVVPVIREQYEIVDSLPDTKRGEGGFGSTGA